MKDIPFYKQPNTKDIVAIGLCKKYTFISLLVLLISPNISAQNYFVDPSFDEPIAPVKTITQCGGNTGETFDKNSNIYFRVGPGTPDVVVPIKEYCARRVNNELIQSPCLGMIFQNDPSRKDRIYKESVYTLLNRPLKENLTYEISFDVLFNTKLYYDKSEIIPYQSSHLNIVLKSSSSSSSDTLMIPVSANSYTNWERSSLVFTSTSAFDIAQFDFFSERLFNSVDGAYIHCYLDNFELVQTTKNPTVFKPVKPIHTSPLSRKEFSYYFDRDKENLSDSEQARLLQDMTQLRLQDIKKISSIGYTDTTHSTDYNINLSSKRAKKVLQTLLENFTDTSITYTVEGKGVDNHQDHQKARRVDLSIEYKESEVARWYQTQTNDQYLFNYSFLGNVEIGKRKNGVPVSKRFRNKDISAFDPIPFDAQKMILAKAKEAKIVIINEAHTSPSHRVFIHQLLPKLKILGYSKLAVEALQSDNHPHSLTIKDPVFLRYLLAAQYQGFELISYDNKTSKEPNWKDLQQLKGVEYAEGFENISKNMNVRDYNQFLNLEDDIDRLLDHEKLIIHVGHGHGGKVQIGDWKPLGSYLSDKYGKKSILSIDQVTLNDCMSLDSNDYSLRYKPSQSIICSSSRNPYIEKEFNPLTMTYESVYDLQILHPQMEAKLSIDTSFIFVQHKDIEHATYPLAIMIYESHAHPRTDVAYSAIEVKHEEEIKPSIIPNNRVYNILIKDANNTILSFESHNQ